MRRAGKPLPFVPTLLGFLFQFEECAILYLMHRMAFVSYRYLVQRGDASENQVSGRFVDSFFFRSFLL